MNYCGMYNWTNDLPKNSKQTFITLLQSLKNKNANILEIGTYSGTSIIEMLKILSNAKADVIDNFNLSKEEFDDCKKYADNINLSLKDVKSALYNNIKLCNMDNRINVIEGNSLKVLLDIKKTKKLYDFIYIDGDHNSKVLKHDLINSWNLLCDNGILAIDDYLWTPYNDVTTPKIVIDEFLKLYEYQYTILHKDYRVFIKKGVTIHNRSYIIKNDEFKIQNKQEFKPLQIRENVSEFDLDIAFIRKLYKKEFGKTFVNYGSSHGLYIPFNLQDIFGNKNIKIVSKKDVSPFEKIEEKIVVSDICIIENGYTDYINIKTNILLTYTKIIIPNYSCFSFNEKFVYVYNNILEKFKKEFVIENNTIKFNNLLNLLIMVKNAGNGFRDILEKNLKYIDHWTILDTGSTDDTIDIIKDVLKDKEGKLYQEPFINFRDSRNRLLELAGEEYAFNIMLDDTYIIEDGDNLRKFLDIVRADDYADSYSIYIHSDGIDYSSNRITKQYNKLKYIYTIHEILQYDDNINVNIPNNVCRINDIFYDYMKVRTNVRKQKDLDDLFVELKESQDSGNQKDFTRTLYYLGETFLCLKKYDRAYEYYQKRTKINYNNDKINNEEIQNCYYKMAVIGHYNLGYSWEKCHQLYLQCFNIDTERSESLAMIGLYYIEKGMYNLSYMYLKYAYSLGFPKHKNMNLKIDIYRFHIPFNLLFLCYIFSDYSLGEKCAVDVYNFNKNKRAESWFSIFKHLNNNTVYRNRFTNKKIYKEQSDIKKQLICFVVPGGWEKWDGETLYTKGLGGSETCIIKFAEYICNSEQYKDKEIIVFCDCENDRVYNNVKYIQLEKYYQFVSEYHIDICIISRNTEYYPLTLKNNVGKIILMLHDKFRDSEIIPISNNLKYILCLTDWHSNYAKSVFPCFKNIIKTMSYGIDKFEEEKEIKKYSFIYPSFPNRGLLPLLKIFPKILEKYPSSILNIFCNLDHSWVNKFYKDEIIEIKSIINKYENIINHGWVDGSVLKTYWSSSHIWLYPCIFEETCCLTAFEAAASKTLIITNNLAGLQDSVGRMVDKRGIIIEGDCNTEEWQEQAIQKVLEIFEDSENVKNQCDKLLKNNYEWSLNKSFDKIVPKFIESYIESLT